MDKHNNKIGVEVTKDNPDVNIIELASKLLDKMVDGEMIMIDPKTKKLVKRKLSKKQKAIIMKRLEKNQKKAKMKFIALFIVIISCEKSSSVTLEYPFKEIEYKVSRHLSEGENKIDLSKLISFDWQYLYIFKPYEELEDINEKLGFEWKNSRETGISQDDNFCLLVFVKNREVIKYINWPRNKGDFSKLGSSKYNKENVSFVIKKEKSGENQEWFYFYNNNSR